VTYTATVTQASGPSTPTGSVTFKDGTATISCTSGNQTLNASGTATCSLPYASTGTHTITAVYSATAGFNASTSSVLTQTVNAASTTAALTSSTATAKTSDTVTYTATVSPVSPGSGVPTGTVTFKDGSSVVNCTGGAQVLNGSGVATCQIAYAAIGTHTITAVYGGTSDFLTPTPATANVKVVQSRVAGLAFSNVILGTASVTPTCTGVIGAASYTCTVSGTGNNAKISANVVFVDASGTATVLSTVDENVTWSADGKTVVNGAALTMPAGTTTSSAVVTATKSGVNNVTITVTYGSWSATLKTSN